MKKKPVMKKVRHDRALRIEHEGEVWIVDAAEWRCEGRGQLRVYRIDGNINKMDLFNDALQLEADARGLSLT